jgi:uncharacterized protein (TIGR03086 family)
MGTNNISDTSLKELFALACERVDSKISQVSESVLNNGTPCSEWDVRALLEHMIEELHWVPPILSGKRLEGAGRDIPNKLLLPDIQTAWERAADTAIQAVVDTDLNNEVELSSGLTKARHFLEEITTDITIHSWDLAQGVGAESQLDEQLVEAVYDIFKEKAEEWHNAGVIGEPIAVSESANTQERLLALAGRF